MGRKKRAVDKLENRNCSEEAVEASVRDEQEEIDPLEDRIDKEALILLHCARFVSAERYDLATVLDDVRLFSTTISVRSRLKMFNEFKQVVVDQRLKSRFKNSCFGGLWDLPEHMKFNGQLVHYTLLHRVELDNKLHEMWFNINDMPACFSLEEFALITGLNCGCYPRDSRYVKAMEEGEAFFKTIVKKKSVNAKRLLKLIRGGRLDKEDKFKCCLVWFVHCILLAQDLSKIVDIDTIMMVDNLGFFEKYLWSKESFSLTLNYLKKRIDFSRQKEIFETKRVSSFEYTKSFPRSTGKMVNQLKIRCPFSNCSDGTPQKRVHPYLIPIIREMKQHYMKKFKAFIDEPNDAFIDGLKACLEGVTIITSSEDDEDGDDDRDLGENVVSKHVTRGVGTSKLRASKKTPMIENLEERVFRLEESIKDIADFVKEERLRRVEKER
ncbi:hypothetical protein P3S68_007395 [Capsicum galapagoense]